VLPYFGDGDELHMNFHFPLMPRMYMALKQEDTTPLRWVFERTPSIPENCQWCTFLRNHDELTLEMVTPEEREYMWREFAPDPRMRLNLGIRRRLAPLLDNDQRKIRLMYSLLFSLPGTPIIYYGDEIGMGDDIELFDRNGVRTPMQWEARLNAGFSPAPPEKLYAPVIAHSPYHAEKVNVASQRDDPDSLLNYLRRLIHLRKQRPELASGSLSWFETGGRAVAAFRREAGGRTVVAVHNLSNATQRALLEPAWSGSPTVDILAGRLVLHPEKPELILAPYQSAWFEW
jgi:maltose alpha-D-glucosyltransferase/alpha-amylase